MKKSVLFVINTLGHAGAETALIELLWQMNPKQYHISLIVLMNQGELVHRLPPYVKLLNQNYKDMSVYGKSGQRALQQTVLRATFLRGTIFWRLPYLVKNLILMIKNTNVRFDRLAFRLIADGAPRLRAHYDLAVAYLEGASTYYLADYVKAAKKAAFLHVDYEQAKYSKALDLDCYLNMDCIFTVSDEVKDSFLKVYTRYRKKTKVFHNLINPDEIRRRAKEAGGFTDHFQGYRILTAGRLVHQKAYDIAVETMRLLKAEGYPVKWYVLGEGILHNKLKKQIKNCELDKDFLLLGHADNPYPYFAQTDFYVHATRFEGKSIAIQEAQILGCAIIASDCSGNREQIISGTDGLLCELTPQKIKESIVSLIQDDALRKQLSEAAKSKKTAHPGELEQLLNLLEE